MEFFEHDTTFDSAGDAHVDGVDSATTADHDSTLGGTDDHYSMLANNGDSSDGSDGYGDSTNSGESASYGDDSSSGGYGDDGSSSGGYGDDSSSSDSSPEATGSAGTVSITVDGHTYTEAGQVDSEGYTEAQFQLPNGETVIAADADHDGQADAAIIENSSGQIIDQQHVDPTSGQWIDDGPGGDSSSGGDSTSGDSTSGTDSDPYPTDTSGDGTDSTDGTSPTSTSSDDGSDGYPTDGSDSSTDGSDGTDGTDGTAAGTIHVEVDGQSYTAAEQYDVNQDGRVDSGVVEMDGKTYLLTDTNGDGTADHVEVGQDGQWKGGYSIGADGQFTPDPGTTPDPSDLPGGGAGDGTSGFTENADYAVDPQTGEWTTH